MITALFLVSIIISSCAILTTAQSDAEVEYYMELIKTNLEKYTVERGPSDASAYIPTSNKVSEFGTFDYIVIGGGSAGAVVASRLSENKQYQVLLIEAGGQENNFTDIPGFYQFLINSPYAWNFKTTSQKCSCFGMDRNQCVYSRGRGLGGSSILNVLNYVRGNKLNYDNWYNQGNPGWAYKDVLPLFLKSENASFNYTDPKYHRRGGNLNVEYGHPHSQPYYAFMEANIEKGQKVVDYNGKQQIGVSETQFNTIRGRRDSSNKAFLRPAYNRPNLKIMTYSFATKININRTTKEAYGVTFSHEQKLYIARARGEIILSAGTFHSPQVLMLSGVGPPEQLRKHGIPLIQSLAVGSNLHDHSGYLNLLFTSNVPFKNTSLEQLVRNYLNGFGDLTFNAEAMSWFQTTNPNIPDFPDLEIVYIIAITTTKLSQIYYNYDNETYNSMFANLDLPGKFSVLPMSMQPKSRGRVTLNSSSPYEFPLVDPKYFSDPEGHDLEVMYQGIKIVLGLIETKAFKKINTTLVPNLTHPKCAKYQFNTKRFWYCQIRHLAVPFCHPVGTCKMGPDPCSGRAVVDSNLRVHGIKKLRVADASIIPTIVSGHTNAPAMMIGEKVSELILNERN